MPEKVSSTTMLHPSTGLGNPQLCQKAIGHYGSRLFQNVFFKQNTIDNFLYPWETKFENPLGHGFSPFLNHVYTIELLPELGHPSKRFPLLHDDCKVFV
jgi:hypothetical protein